MYLPAYAMGCFEIGQSLKIDPLRFDLIIVLKS